MWVWLVLFQLETLEKFLIKVQKTYRRCPRHECTNLRICTNSGTQMKKKTVPTTPEAFFLDHPRVRTVLTSDSTALLTVSFTSVWSCGTCSCPASSLGAVCESHPCCWVTWPSRPGATWVCTVRVRSYVHPFQ